MITRLASYLILVLMLGFKAFADIDVNVDESCSSAQNSYIGVLQSKTAFDNRPVVCIRVPQLGNRLFNLTSFSVYNTVPVGAEFTFTITSDCTGKVTNYHISNINSPEYQPVYTPVYVQQQFVPVYQPPVYQPPIYWYLNIGRNVNFGVGTGYGWGFINYCGPYRRIIW